MLSLGITESKNTVLLVPSKLCQIRAEDVESRATKATHLDTQFQAHGTASSRSKGRNEAEVALLVQTVNSALYLELGSSFLCKSTRRQLSAAAVEDTPEARAMGARREGREGLGARPDKAPLTAFLGIHDVQGKQHGVGECGRLFLTCEV